MLVSVLASGSKGNATLIRTEKLNILIDAGMNTKYIKGRLEEFGLTPLDIDYIFITHTHKDHIGALKTLVKNYSPTVCVGKKMLNELECLINYENILIISEYMELEDVFVESIKTSHDASESVGYIFTHKESSLVYITDTGYINNKYYKQLYNKTMYIMESNHDVEMLMHSRYPTWVKQRILGDRGHLSNHASSIYLSKLIGNNTKYVVLAHLSHENNTPEIAIDTLKSTLKEYGVNFRNYSVAYQDKKTENYNI